MKNISNGIYPTMITPYQKNGDIDMGAVNAIVEWYIARGVDGIFAVCQSSEMFYLSGDERMLLARRVVDAARGRVAVVASGHVSDSMQDQIKELRAVADTGVDAVVLVSNRMAKDYEPDSVLMDAGNRLLDALPEVPFGIYECPHPYKRLLSDDVLRWCAQTGRFVFIKDTCCDAERITGRLQVLQGSGVKLFNANTATLLETMRHGCAGFSGIMANFHPELYAWLFRNYETSPREAETLQAFLSLASGVERGFYPACAKYHMNRIGIPMQLTVRNRNMSQWTHLHAREIEDMLILERDIADRLGLAVR